MPRLTLIRDLIHSLDESLKVGYCPKRLNMAVEVLGLPRWLKQLLWWSWINKSGYLNRAYAMMSVAEILRHPELDRYLSEKMLPIGSAANGDQIVIRFDDDRAEIGMISHEEVWDKKQLVEVYHEVVPTLEEFLLRIVDEMYLPIDSFAAREFASLRSDMRGTDRR